MTANASWIDVPTAGGKCQAYLSLPPTGSGPGILLIQEIFGVNTHIRAVADQYAQDGYVVLAPDLFWRQKPRIELGYAADDMTQGIAMMSQADIPQTIADLSDAAKALRARPESTGSGIAGIGYCFGGRLTYLLAAAGVIDVAIPYYGGGIQNETDKAAAIGVPMLMHFGEKDSMIPQSAVQKIRDSLAGKRNVDIHVYPEADHGFNCWARGSYHQRSAALAHGRSLEFLASHLG